MSLDCVQVSTFMTQNVRTATSDLTVKTVAGLMVKHDVGSIVILHSESDRRVLGIITEKDVVRLVGKDESIASHLQVGKVMSSPVIAIESSACLRDALEVMQRQDIRRLPVVDHGIMIGIITEKDIFRTIMKNQPLLEILVSGGFNVENRPVFDTFSEFMLEEMLHPNRR